MTAKKCQVCLDILGTCVIPSKVPWYIKKASHVCPLCESYMIYRWLNTVPQEDMLLGINIDWDKINFLVPFLKHLYYGRLEGIPVDTLHTTFKTGYLVQLPATYDTFLKNLERLLRG